jgi:hypothetical protein
MKKRKGRIIEEQLRILSIASKNSLLKENKMWFPKGKDDYISQSFNNENGSQ